MSSEHLRLEKKTLKILIVRLSSLGDVVLTLPVVQDLLRSFPHAQIDWVAEPALLPMLSRCPGINRTIGFGLREWRKNLLKKRTWQAFFAFKDALQSVRYDAVLDVHGLSKSALVAKLAKVRRHGHRYAMANGSQACGYEAPTRWVGDVLIPMPKRIHAVSQARIFCARALGYAVPSELRWGLVPHVLSEQMVPENAVLLAHGSSKQNKTWPDQNWIELGKRLLDSGKKIVISHGSTLEKQVAEHLVEKIGRGAQLFPSADTAKLVDLIAQCTGVIGVDTGLSHIAVALDLPHVQLYNFETEWRTGPICSDKTSIQEARQVALFHSPCPSVDAVWDAWQRAIL